MIVHEIVSTCSNPHVARAALASIGGDFARRFECDAANRNLSSGMLASDLVRHFAHRASNKDWQGVGEATRNTDMPILSGLRYILERELKEKDIRVLREDLLQVSEVGGLLGSALAVRREALPPEAVEFAQSRRPRVEVILKDQLEKKLRALPCSKNSSRNR